MDAKSKQNLIPRLKKIELDLGSSLRYSRFTERNPDAKAFWHYHPEVELVYVKKGVGNRFVGNHVSRFEHGDLILMGPDIPHFGYEFGLQGVHEEIVVHFKKDLIKTAFQLMPEFEKIEALIEKAKSGLVFSGQTREEVSMLLESMEKKSAFDRLQCMLKVLHILANSQEYDVLNAKGLTLIIQNQEDDRINQVYDYVKTHYEDDISLEEISQVALMTVPAFCRFFKKSTKKTFTQFVNEFRVRQAIRLLSQSNKSLTEISGEVGFNSFSHFTKQFKRITSKTPSQYKKTMYQVISE